MRWTKGLAAGAVVLATGAVMRAASAARSSDPSSRVIVLERARLCALPPGVRTDAELAFLKTALRITGAEDEAWNALAQSLRKHAARRDSEMAAACAATDHAALPTPDALTRLDRWSHALAEDAKDAAALLAVAKPLYAKLSEEQKRVADALAGDAFGPPGPFPFPEDEPGPLPPFGPPDVLLP